MLEQGHDPLPLTVGQVGVAGILDGFDDCLGEAQQAPQLPSPLLALICFIQGLEFP